MLESRPIGRRGAYDRVLNQVLNRYIVEDKRFLEKNAKFNVHARFTFVLRYGPRRSIPPWEKLTGY